MVCVLWFHCSKLVDLSGIEAGVLAWCKSIPFRPEGVTVVHFVKLDGLIYQSLSGYPASPEFIR